MNASDALAVVIWWIIIQVCGWLVWPLAFRWLRWLPDRGYMVAKPLGLLLVSYSLWLLTSFGIIQNTQIGILIALILVAGISQLTYRRAVKKTAEHLLDQLRAQRRLIIAYELLFAAAFIAWAMFRAHNPDALSGEKPMELAFLNALGRSTSFPPYDPWLAGYTMSYYYFGYVMMSILAKVSGMAAGLTFGLSNALWFALSAVGAFGIVANVVLLMSRTAKSAAITFGLIGAVLLAVLGNFEAPLEVARVAGIGSPEFWAQLDILDLNQPYVPPVNQSRWPPRTGGVGWWWRASRVIHDYWPMDISPRLGAVMGAPSDSPTAFQELIDEFPQFSFLLGDMHPHVLDLPFVLLALSLALNLFQAGASEGMASLWRDIPVWLMYPLVLGGLSFLNTWDFPIYLFIAIAALNLARCLIGKFRMRIALIESLLLGLLSVLMYLPYYLNVGPQVSGVAPNIFNGTSAAQFFVMFGPFLVIGICFISKLILDAVHARQVRPLTFGLQAIAGGIGLILIAIALAAGVLQLSSSARAWLDSLMGPMTNRGITLAAHLLARLSDPWLPFSLAVGLLAVFLLWRSRLNSDHRLASSRPTDFILLLFLVGLLLALGPEFAFIAEVSGTRTNTVFKIYYQVWVLWSVASACSAYYLLSGPFQLQQRFTRAAFAAMLLVVIGLGMAYPLLALPTRIAETTILEPALNVLEATARSPRGRDIADAYAAAQWLNQQVPGAPILLEAASDELWPDPARSRISAWTGLPTLLGWFGIGHETQWRGSDEVLRQRLPDVDKIYSTTDVAAAQALIQRYAIAYVYVGPLERQQYPAEGLAKFDRMLSVAFRQNAVTIYRVP